MLDERIGAGNDESDVAIVGPSHEVGRGAVFPVDFDNLCIAVGFTEVMALHDEPVAGTCLHGCTSSLDPASSTMVLGAGFL
jgi:hypothetical protein